MEETTRSLRPHAGQGPVRAAGPAAPASRPRSASAASRAGARADAGSSAKGGPAASGGLPHGARACCDFREPAGLAGWQPVDDVVMGGRCASRLVARAGCARFEGELSLERGGGFASVRSGLVPLDLGGFAGLAVRCRGDGREYALRVRVTSAFEGVSWTAPLHPPAGGWTTLVLPFDAFTPTFRGRRVPEAGPLDATHVRSFGLLLADGRPGAFRLDVAWIAAVRTVPRPSAGSPPGRGGDP